uniref:Tyrosine-protein kinase ephrin type A/B receptor-like domain-containing protein n=1 Tax=Tetradesmus obliquus TaxID=3088 RepID=A0A383VTT6_TETOB|eukprot:jgi/Sobl393_1/17108/SZX68249.1
MGDMHLYAADCAPGLAMDANKNCIQCSVGKYCLGGDATLNPQNKELDCPKGLQTTFAGAKSQAQCFTKPGYGRTSRTGSDGKVYVSGALCEAGRYNVGSNTAGCQQCGAGLTTATNGSTSAAACMAPPGSYLDNSSGKKCQKGTFSTDFNLNSTCDACPDGITTIGDGSTSAAACSLAQKGFYINPDNAAEALECPLDTYQDQEAAVNACTPCRNGWRTQETGAIGDAACLAPPGFELKDGATNITACAVGSYKADWNRNPCVACGTGLITSEAGAISKDACLIPAGWGLTSAAPMVAAPCEKNMYGEAEDRVAAANARCTPCPARMFTLDTIEDRTRNENEYYTSEAACLKKLKQ